MRRREVEGFGSRRPGGCPGFSQEAGDRLHHLARVLHGYEVAGAWNGEERSGGQPPEGFGWLTLSESRTPLAADEEHRAVKPLEEGGAVGQRRVSVGSGLGRARTAERRLSRGP